MKVHLVRHAKPEKRAAWPGPDRLRPLSARGVDQAESLVEQLAGRRIDRILSSPALRCQQTVSPLARARELPAESHEALAADADPLKTAEWLKQLDAKRVLCCTHAEFLVELAGELEDAGVAVNRLTRETRTASTDSESERLGVLDLGSTSFHLLVADVTRGGRLTPVGRERVQLRLGSVMAKGDRIPEEVCRRAVRTGREMRSHARDMGAERLFVVGTEALRETRNGPELAAELESVLGQPIQLLTGAQEARHIFQAFRRRVLLPDGPVLGVDLGGGSLELALGRDNTVDFECSLPLGAARLHGELVAHDPMEISELRAVCERVDRTLDPVAKPIRRGEPRLAVVAGGTARALGHLAVGMRGMRSVSSVNELVLPLDELRSLAEVLTRADHAERLDLPGMRRRRADLLPTGTLVLLRLAERLRLDGFTITDWGLREGVLLEAVDAP